MTFSLRLLNCFFFSLLDHYALCLSYHSSTERFSLQSFIRLGHHHHEKTVWPQDDRGVFLKNKPGFDFRRDTPTGVETRFRNLSPTIPTLYQLSCVAAICYYQDWGAGVGTGDPGAAWFGRNRSWNRSYFTFSSGAGALKKIRIEPKLDP